MENLVCFIKKEKIHCYPLPCWKIHWHPLAEIFSSKNLVCPLGYRGLVMALHVLLVLEPLVKLYNSLVRLSVKVLTVFCCKFV